MTYYTREASLVIKGVGSQGDGTVQVRTCFYPILASFFSPFYTTFIFLSFFPLSSFLPYLHLFLLLISLYLILPLHPHVFSTTLLFSWENTPSTLTSQVLCATADDQIKALNILHESLNCEAFTLTVPAFLPSPERPLLHPHRYVLMCVCVCVF